jgi:hypothetical protein
MCCNDGVCEGDGEADEQGRDWAWTAQRLFCWRENLVLLLLFIMVLIMSAVSLHQIQRLHQAQHHAARARRFCVQLRVTRTDDGSVDEAAGAGQLSIDAYEQRVEWDFFMSGARNVTGLGIFGPLQLSAAGGDMQTAYSLAPLALSLRLTSSGGAQSDARLLGAAVFSAPRGSATDDNRFGDNSIDDLEAAVDTLTSIVIRPELYFVSILELQHPRIGVLNGLLGSTC